MNDGKIKINYHHHQWLPKKALRCKLWNPTGIGPSRSLFEKFTLRPCWWNLGIRPWNPFWFNISSLNLVTPTKDLGIGPTKEFRERWSLVNANIRENSRPLILPDSRLPDRYNPLSHMSRPIFGIGPSNWLFMKLMLLNDLSSTRGLVSRWPESFMFSRTNFWTLPPTSQNTPIHTDSWPLHGDVSGIQLWRRFLGSDIVDLNLRRWTASVWETVVVVDRRRMQNMMRRATSWPREPPLKVISTSRMKEIRRRRQLVVVDHG